MYWLPLEKHPPSIMVDRAYILQPTFKRVLIEFPRIDNIPKSSIW